MWSTTYITLVLTECKEIMHIVSLANLPNVLYLLIVLIKKTVVIIIEFFNTSIASLHMTCNINIPDTIQGLYCLMWLQTIPHATWRVDVPKQ